ncbi:Reticulocyte-binding protein 2-like protein a [Diplonema papillatum]|nr:Reticulocyte-binding protein 2-like protein a [Diplonema papillatum]
MEDLTPDKTEFKKVKGVYPWRNWDACKKRFVYIEGPASVEFTAKLAGGTDKDAFEKWAQSVKDVTLEELIFENCEFILEEPVPVAEKKAEAEPKKEEADTAMKTDEEAKPDEANDEKPAPTEDAQDAAATDEAPAAETTEEPAATEEIPEEPKVEEPQMQTRTVTYVLVTGEAVCVHQSAMMKFEAQLAKCPLLADASDNKEELFTFSNRSEGMLVDRKTGNFIQADEVEQAMASSVTSSKPFSSLIQAATAAKGYSELHSLSLDLIDDRYIKIGGVDGEGTKLLFTPAARIAAYKEDGPKRDLYELEVSLRVGDLLQLPASDMVVTDLTPLSSSEAGSDKPSAPMFMKPMVVVRLPLSVGDVKEALGLPGKLLYLSLAPCEAMADAVYYDCRQRKLIPSIPGMQVPPGLSWPTAVQIAADLTLLSDVLDTDLAGLYGEERFKVTDELKEKAGTDKAAWARVGAITGLVLGELRRSPVFDASSDCVVTKKQPSVEQKQADPKPEEKKADKSDHQESKPSDSPPPRSTPASEGSNYNNNNANNNNYDFNNRGVAGKGGSAFPGKGGKKGGKDGGKGGKDGGKGGKDGGKGGKDGGKGGKDGGKGGKDGGKGGKDGGKDKRERDEEGAGHSPQAPAKRARYEAFRPFDDVVPPRRKDGKYYGIEVRAPGSGELLPPVLEYQAGDNNAAQISNSAVIYLSCLARTVRERKKGFFLITESIHNDGKFVTFELTLPRNHILGSVQGPLLQRRKLFLDCLKQAALEFNARKVPADRSADKRDAIAILKSTYTLIFQKFPAQEQRPETHVMKREEIRRREHENQQREREREKLEQERKERMRELEIREKEKKERERREKEIRIIEEERRRKEAIAREAVEAERRRREADLRRRQDEAELRKRRELDKKREEALAKRRREEADRAREEERKKRDELDRKRRREPIPEREDPRQKRARSDLDQKVISWFSAKVQSVLTVVEEKGIKRPLIEGLMKEAVARPDKAPELLHAWENRLTSLPKTSSVTTARLTCWYLLDAIIKEEPHGHDNPFRRHIESRLSYLTANHLPAVFDASKLDASFQLVGTWAGLFPERLLKQIKLNIRTCQK